MRKKLRFASALSLISILVCAAAQAQTDPHITSWLTSKSAQYARVWETASDKSSGNAVSTWPRAGLTNGGGGQATNAYSDVQRVAYSTNYVYITTTGLASYTMGNWLTPNGMTYTSWPTNRAAIHRIPRTPSIPTSKPKSGGNGGVLVNGVFVWQNGDAQSYNTSTGTVSMAGSGIWNRLAGVAEAFNFDTGNAHQPNSGAYHNHINPIALRYQLGDNVSYNVSTKTYSEATPTKHSPIIGWALDGLPIYGPYGYSSAMDATSGVRRMTTGFQKRNGTNGTVNLATTGRVTLPVWAASVQGKSQTLAASEYGPATTATYAAAPGITATYSIGIFAEDYEYLGDVGKIQGVDFDLNRQNVRFCVTPEYPSGTYAYFVCIDASGATVFPDIINQEFFGTPVTGTGTVTSINETVTDYVAAGPASTITLSGVASGGGVALTWNSAEGATYKVEASADNSTWTTLSSTVTSGGLTTNYAATTSNYYRVTLTAIASYDTGGTYGTPVGKTASFTYSTPAATAPAITSQPSNATVTVGATATFTVAASGTAPLTYQWRKDGVAISGATAASYSIANAQTTHAGNYTCVVTNSAGSATSTTATLTVTNAAVAPTIVTQPASATALIGGSATFSVAASGTAPFTYQWRKDGAAISGATAASYALTSVQTAAAGNYTVVVTNSAGSVTSTAAALTVAATAVAPSIATQPASQVVTVGTDITFTVVASGTSPFTYQWRKNDVAISGAVSASFSVANAQTSDGGNYSVVVTNSAGSVTSNAATLVVNSSGSSGGDGSSGGGSGGGGGSGDNSSGAGTGRLIAVSTRGRVGGVAGTPIPGFAITGGGGKRMLVRAIGPTLAPLGVNGVLADPQFDVYSNGVFLGGANDWVAADAPVFSSIGASPLLPNSKDAALVATFAPGAYTTPVRGGDDSGGVALLEVYDADASNTSSKLAAVSTRAYVGTNDEVLIPGFVIAGPGNLTLLIRAVGPTLSTLFGLPDYLADPQMTLYSGPTPMLTNDNWSEVANASAVATAAVRSGSFALPSGSKDAAILVTLEPGVYTVIVSGVAATTGTALVEIYIVP